VSTINAKCCHVNSQFRRGFVLSTVDIPAGSTQPREARDDSDRSSRLSAYAAASICVRWTENVGTVQTQFRGSGFQSGVDVEDDQPERPAHGRSENRCSGRHPGYPRGCWSLPLERSGWGRNVPSEGRADDLARARSIAEAALRACAQSRARSLHSQILTAGAIKPE
jgi:hypothetical protein